MSDADAKNLPSELETELAALLPFADLATAVAVCNGRNGGRGLRQKYLSRLYAARVTYDLTQSLAGAINRLLDREIALLAPIQDREHAGGRGWTSWPINSLTDEERNAL